MSCTANVTVLLFTAQQLSNQQMALSKCTISTRRISIRRRTVKGAYRAVLQENSPGHVRIASYITKQNTFTFMITSYLYRNFNSLHIFLRSFC